MELAELRQEIDRIDEQMVELFQRRMEISGQVASYKREHSLPVMDKTRERTILTRVTALASEPMEGYTRLLYSMIFDMSRSYQISLNAKHGKLEDAIAEAIANTDEQFPKKGFVACQGVEGAYSQMACDRLFPMANLMYFRTFEGVFQAVEKGLCHFGVLPIENSSYGSVNNVYDLMRHYKFSIVRSIKLHIDHNLMAKPGVALKDIKEVFSHEQAIGQCSKFLSAHPEIKVTVCENTAAAAKLVAESERSDIAALSSHNCAALYGLEVLDGQVQNSENNYTRFICITKDLAIYPGSTHISLMFSIPHRPGALYEMIAQFSALGLNLTKLESRPIPGRDFEFMFYFDLEASVWAPEVVKLLGELSAANEQFVFLGSYSEV